jgi:hypothetical protein
MIEWVAHMQPSGLNLLRDRRVVIALLALLGCAFYAWQVENAWADHIRPSLDVTGRGLSLTSLTGRGVATGATATLSVDSLAKKAVLQLDDMPALPAGQAYQIWCVADTGEVDASSIFHISFDGQDSSTQVIVTECQRIQLVDQAVVMQTPHSMEAYHHFMVTIEPDGGSKTPSGQVVLAN